MNVSSKSCRNVHVQTYVGFAFARAHFVAWSAASGFGSAGLVAVVICAGEHNERCNGEKPDHKVHG